MTQLFLLLLIAVMYLPMQAQSDNKQSEINVVLHLNDNQQFIILESSSVKSDVSALEVIVDKELQELKLSIGTILNGRFEYNGISGGDLGSGRIVEGTFTVVTATDASKKQLDCPPICKKSFTISLKLAESSLKKE